MTTRRWLALLLLAALAQGLVRIVVIPLWGHYDEAAHFEYVRFVQDRRAAPRIGDTTPEVVRRIAATDRTMTVCDATPGLPDCLGSGAAFDEVPVYYFLQAGVAAMVGPMDIGRELRLARLVSVLLHVLVVWLGVAAVRVAVPGDDALALAVGGLLAAVPAFGDLMSGLNNEVGAVAAFSFLTWTVARMLRRGVTAAHAILLLVAVLLCLGTKATAWIGVPLAGFGVWLAAWPRIPSWTRWTVVAACPAVAVLALFTLDWPADWQARGAIPAPNLGRVATDVPWGQHALSARGVRTREQALWQTVADADLATLRGRDVTLGVWARARNRTGVVAMPVVAVNGAIAAPATVLSPQWTFHRRIVAVPDGATALSVYVPLTDHGAAEYDGIVLVSGARSETSPPRFEDASLSRGEWDGVPFRNLIRNGSAEAGWPMLRPAIDRFVPGGGLNFHLVAWLDWRRTAPQFWPPIKWQFITFWTGYGTGTADGPRWARVAFALLTGAAVLGTLVGLGVARRAPSADGAAVRFFVFCGAAVAAAALMSILRIDPADIPGRAQYVPTARHAAVAMLPAMVLVAHGWGAWWPSRARRTAFAAVVAAVFLIGAYLFVFVQRPWYNALECVQTACSGS